MQATARVTPTKGLGPTSRGRNTLILKTFAQIMVNTMDYRLGVLGGMGPQALPTRQAGRGPLFF